MKSIIEDQLPIITLVGPPNSGKTTLFNLLSGKNFKTVNYPGSTVEYSTSKIHSKFGVNGLLLDSPGIISLNPNSPDEEVAINSLYNHPDFGEPNLVITTVDASQLSRHLLLSEQLIESGFRVIVVITMIDLLAKRGYKIDDKILAKELGCDVISIDNKREIGLDRLLDVLSTKLSNIQTNLSSKRNLNKSFKSKEDLLNLYKKIEAIEKKVVVPILNSADSKIEAANKKLKILNPTLKYGSNRPDELTLKIDKFLLHRTWGLVFFFLIMSFIFMSIFWLAEPFMSLIDKLFGFLAFSASNLLGDNWYGNLISDGIISGTGAVLVFLPQILILFLILGLLEDTGYLARGADRKSVV